ncbi:hypothetical protein D3C80_1902230 [compost metagenome]
MDQADRQPFSIAIDRLLLAQTGAGTIQPTVMQEPANSLCHHQRYAPAGAQLFKEQIVDLLAYLLCSSHRKPSK